jgi:hypothetical protein
MKAKVVFSLCIAVFVLAVGSPVVAQLGLSWREDFEHNNGNWALGEADDYRLEMKDGLLLATAKKNGLWITQEVAPDRGKDHRIGITLRSDSPTPTDYSGLIWDFRDKDNYYAFLVTQDGRYGVVRRDGGKSSLIMGWHSSPEIMGRGRFNTLEVRRTGSDLVFSINGKDHNRMSFAGLAGKEVGFIFSGTQTAAIDEMHLYETRTPAGEALSIPESDETLHSSSFTKREIMNTPQIMGITAEFKEDGASGPGYVIKKFQRKSVESIGTRYDFDLSRDFSIEMKLGWASGDDNRGYGLVVDKIDDDFLFFALSADGYFSIRRSARGSDREIVPWTKSANVNTYEGPNLLAILRRGEKLIFTLNGRKVHEMPYEGFRSTELGFGADGIMSFRPLALRISRPPEAEGPVFGDCSAGYGVFLYKDGSRHAGFWSGGLPQGPGVRYGKDGSIQEGIWNRGVLAAASAPPAPGFFPVAKKSLDWGYVDASGKALGFGLKTVAAPDRPGAGPLPVSDGERIGFALASGGARYSDDWDLASGFVDGYALIRGKNGGTGILHESGKVTVTPGSQDIDVGAGISRGLVRIRKTQDGKTFYGLLSVGGQVVRKPDLLEIGEFSGGLAKARVAGGLYGFIDVAGVWRIPPKYDTAGDYSEEGIVYVLRDGYIPIGEFIDRQGSPRGLLLSQQLIPPYRFGEGLAAVADKYGYVGFVDRGAKTVIEPGDWDDAKPFSEGLAAVHLDGDGWGFIDKKGSVVVPEAFDSLEPFSMGLAAAEVDGEWGYLDREGNWAIMPAFEEAYPFREPGLAQVKTKDGFWTWIDREGRPIWTGEVNLVIVGVEEFDKNERAWPVLTTKTVNSSMKKGLYTITAKTADGAAIAKEWGFERLEDYAIEATLRFTGKGTEDMASFIWELRDWDNLYYFNISRQGVFSVTRRVEGANATLIDWTPSDAIDRGLGDNRLAIRRRDAELEFSINDTLVGSIPLESVAGEALGFFVSGKASIAVDSVVLRMVEE